MYNKNILDPLKTFVPKVRVLVLFVLSKVINSRNGYSLQISSALATYLSSNQNAPQDSLSLVFQLAENTITLFWCLSSVNRPFPWVEN